MATRRQFAAQLRHQRRVERRYNPSARGHRSVLGISGERMGRREAKRGYHYYRSAMSVSSRRSNRRRAAARPKASPKQGPVLRGVFGKRPSGPTFRQRQAAPRRAATKAARAAKKAKAIAKAKRTRARNKKAGRGGGGGGGDA